MKCVSGKICYDTKELAEEALIQNRSRYFHTDESGPINVYQCEDCDFYHFTSKGPISDILKSDTNRERISREREASFWESKLRR